MPLEISNLVARNQGVRPEYQRRKAENLNLERILPDGTRRDLEDWEFFENRVWLLFHRFEESENNKLVNFLSISNEGSIVQWGSGGGQSQQIDGFFVSNSISFITESFTGSSRAIGEKINDFSDWKNRLIVDAGIKRTNLSNPSIDFTSKYFIWILFTKNKPNESQIQQAERAGIKIIDERKIEYMENLLNVYGADYSNLAFTNFVKDVIGERVPTGNNVRIPAIRYKYGEGTGSSTKYCYSAVVKPDDIMDLCSVIHRKAGLDLDQSYQRFVATSRLGKIKEFVDEESPDKISQFSNNLILCSESLDEGGSRSFTLAPQEHQADNSRNAGKVGILNLPSVFGDLHIIDGQHRLFGYNKAQNKDKHYVNVLIFNHQMSLLQQMNVFKDINENQKKLNSNLKWELYEHTLDNNDIKQQISAFFNKNLIDSNFSLYKRVQVGTSIQKEGKGPLALSLLNICQEMTRYKRENTTSVLFDYLYSLFDEGEKDIKTMKLLNGFCNALKENSPQDWDMNSHGLILSGNFFRGLLRVLREILWTWEQDATLSSKLSDIDNIDNHFKSFLLPFNEYVNQFDLSGDYEESKKNKSDVKTGNNFLGGGGPKKIASFIAGIIRSSSPAMENFGNDSIYRENIDRETWYQYASNVLNDVGETNDIEAKDSIFVNKVPLGPNRRLIDVDLSDDIHKRKVKEIAIKRLRTLAAFYNYCGGIYIIGVKDGSWREDGCQNEIETYGGYDSWKDKVMDLIRQASAENSTDLSSRCKFFKQELDNGKIIAGISVKRKSDSLNFIKWDTGITGNEYYYRQDGRTPEAIINPTESDFSRLHSWRNDEMESIEEYFTLNQYRTYSEENGRTFEAMYSDQFRVNF